MTVIEANLREAGTIAGAPQRVDDWFAARGWSAFPFQRATWRAYLEGRSGLVHAPTGMGKTYAVWLGPLLEEMATQITEDEPLPPPPLRGRVGEGACTGGSCRVVWITPLRALAADTAENLRAAVDALQIPWRIELRTGDTAQSIRARQRQRLPETLITTPESLSVLLSYPGASNHFRGLRCIVVDEWHELMSTKRGVQTELGLARLRALAPSVRTWGLSATMGNLEEAMDVLMGREGPPSLPGREGCVLIRGEAPKTIVVETLRPDDVERFPWSGHIGLKLLPQVIAALERARTTLLFCNVRSQAEIWFQAILKSRPDLIGQIALHHGSLDRDIRAQVEDMLRRGAIKCVVCTSSLDLGVDFSPVDQVMQIGSPKGIARMMQRAGRSGHQPGAASRILGVPTNALELVEFAAARDAVSGGPGAQSRGIAMPRLSPEVESRHALDRPLDVLVQHMVTLAAGDGFDAEELHNEVRTTAAFAQLSDDEWRWCLDFITQGGPALHAYPQYSRVTKRAEDGRYFITSRQIERLHRMSIGTITSDAAVRVAFQNGTTLGSIEESFISRLRPRDRFVFAGRVLELIRLHNLVAHVRPARQRSGAMAKWMGSKCPLSTLLAQAIRAKLEEARQGRFIGSEMQLVKPLLEVQAQWSRIPAPDELLIERRRSRDGHHVYLFPFEGRLVHEGLAALLAHRLTRRRPSSILVTANDYGIELLSPQPFDLDELEWRGALATEHLVRDLLECVNTTALARRQFREIARVAGLLFPGFPGQSKSTRQLQASSEMFFQVFTEFDPANLLLNQAKREVLDRELEVVRLRGTLERIAASRFVIIDTPRLTPLSFPLWAESIRSHHVSSENWSDRVRRMVVMLEKEAGRIAGNA